MIKNLKFSLLGLIFILFNIFSLMILNLYYPSNRSPDLNRYSKYLDYFNKNIENTDLEQGLLYFFIVFVFLNLFERSHNFELLEQNNELLFSLGLQTINTFLFLISLLGLYFLLRQLSFDKANIIFSLSVITILPQALKLKSTMKPEIMAFCIITWVLYLVEKYKSNGKFIYIVNAVIGLGIISTLKASIFAITLLCLIFLFYKEIKATNYKKLTLLFLVFVIVFIPIYMENLDANQRALLDRNDLLDDFDQQNYDNKASLGFVFNINFKDIISNPVSNYHADSLIGITLFDTFGDYYNLYWNLDYSNFSESRKQFIKKNTNNNFRNDFINRTLYIPQNLNFNLEYLRKYFAFGIGFSYFLTLIYFFKKNKEKYLFLPFIGILTLTLNAFGIPENNFDPLVGDTLKPFYYSFVSLITISYLMCFLLKKNKSWFYVMILIVFILFFIYGFPKENNSDLDSNLSEINNITYFCEINQIYLEIALLEKENMNCEEKPKNDKDENREINIPSVNIIYFVLFYIFIFFTNFYDRYFSRK